ncbi:hypothetical protein O181_077053 [Austropuccinia psidii MF-1]|uniref:Uncharacterized protein n=1 Tax=Austropuccinia psidii MF-1 TaxID=1389203 RepID=A0A9Q3IDD3_9BASI|nr:hypothetical protein [Austropuccinia psidii MF-1]
MIDSFVAQFTIVRPIIINAVEVRLTDGFNTKHAVFSVSLVKPYNQKDDNKFINSKNIVTHEILVEEYDSPGPVKRRIKASKIRINGKDNRQYLVRFKSLPADKN